MHIWDMLASCSERWLGDKGNNSNNIQIMSVPTMDGTQRVLSSTLVVSWYNTSCALVPVWH